MIQHVKQNWLEARGVLTPPPPITPG